MKITFIFDDSYISQFLTVTNSILKNEKPEFKDKIIFYINYFGKQESINKLLNLASTNFPNNTFKIKHIPSEFPDLFKKQESNYKFDISAEHIQTSSVYCRFYLDEIWPEVNDVLLHLDLDLIVKNSISDLFDQFNSEFYFHACAGARLLFDIFPKFNSSLKKIYSDKKNLLSNYEEEFKYFENKKFNFNDKGFNAGVFAINLGKYRSLKISKKCEFLMFCHSFEKLFHHNDQGILNAVFYGLTQFIDPNWNCLGYGWYNWRNEKVIEKKFEHGHIIHYNGPIKPWLDTKKNNYKYFRNGVKLWKLYEITY